jgi:GNAT superfamily N-acetyltransferase
LNEWFEDSSSKTKAQTTSEWIRSTLETQTIWIVAKDSRGTVRGCVSSFISESPYPSSISPSSWGLVDWFCVHPLWRSKGLGSALLETLDLVTYRLGRRAHIFLKEGNPLPLPHLPIYCTWLKCRKAGNPSISRIKEETIVHLYREVERSTGLPLIRVEGLTTHHGLDKWEEALDDLPECWVFVSGECVVNDKKGWRTDSLVSMYAFRWSPGKWLGSCPSQAIL